MLKKILSIVLLAILTFPCFGQQRASAAVKTLWNDSSIKVNVYADFNNLQNGEILLGPQSAVCVVPRAQTAITADIHNGTFRITSNPNGEHPAAGAMILDFGYTLDPQEISKATGAGFYFENHMNDGVWIIAAFCFDGVYKRLADNSQYILVPSSDLSAASTGSVPNQGQIYIPQGFKGYVLYSLADLKDDFRHSGAKPGMVGLRFGGVKFTENSGQTMVWDNFFIWGENVTENNNILPKLPQLTDLQLIGARMDVPFSPNERSYFAEVDYTVSTISVKADAQEGVTLKCNGAKLRNGEQSAPIPIRTGANTITIEAESQGVTAKTVITVIKNMKPELLYNEEMRPQFHFTPYMFSLNDPNGLIYNPVTKQYHMYFQCDRPFRTEYAVDGNAKSWGHAVSYDLVNWEELPLAIMPDDNGTIWSGSAVIDVNNTSGFFDDSTPPGARMVALYTYYGATKSTNGLCSVGIAYSKDNGTTWIKPFTDPIIPNTNNMYQPGMRDPKVYWFEDESYEMGGIWMMVVAGGRAQIFTSPDLIHWTRDRQLVDINRKPLDSECPDLFPLPVDGDENNIKWVYSGGGTFYIIGDVVRKDDGKLDFIAQTDKIYPVNGVSELWPGSGLYPEMYASQTFFNDPKGRKIEISWMRDLVSLEGKNWYSVESLALELKLVTVNGEIKLFKYPVEELTTLRSARPIFQAQNVNIAPDTENILKDLNETLYDIEATFVPGTAEEFGFLLRVKGSRYIKVAYDAKNNTLITDKNGISSLISGKYATKMQPMPDGRVKMRIIVDSSVIDVFGNGGEVFHNGLTYASAANTGMKLYATGGDVLVDDLKIYSMNPMNRTAVSNPVEPAEIPAPANNQPPKKALLNNTVLTVIFVALVLLALGLTAYLITMRAKSNNKK